MSNGIHVPFFGYVLLRLDMEKLSFPKLELLCDGDARTFDARRHRALPTSACTVNYGMRLRGDGIVGTWSPALYQSRKV